MTHRSLGMLILSLPLAVTLCGDTLVLRNGSQVSGKFVSGQNGSVMFDQGGGQTRRFNVNEIARIEFNGSGGPAEFGSDNFGNDQHGRYDQYRNRPDYRNSQQPQGGAIAAKYQDMNRAGIALGQPVSAEQTSSDGQGRFRVYQNSTVYWSPNTGAHEVHGAIRDQYVRLGAENSRLGYPISDELPAPDGVGRINNFEGGSIYWNPRTGARVDYANNSRR